MYFGRELGDGEKDGKQSGQCQARVEFDGRVRVGRIAATRLANECTAVAMSIAMSIASIGVLGCGHAARIDHRFGGRLSGLALDRLYGTALLSFSLINLGVQKWNR